MNFVQRVDPTDSLHKVKKIFKFFNLYEMLDINLLWQSFYRRCKSNHYAVHSKCIQCCMSIISQ